MKFYLVKVEQCFRPFTPLFKKRRSIIISARNKKQKKYYFLINDFYPRCYVKKDEFENKNLNKSLISKTSDDKKHHYITEDPMITVYLKDTSKIYPFRESMEETFMSDILYEEVFKTEVGLNCFFEINNLNKKLKIRTSYKDFLLISYKDIKPFEN